jgi:hypothetical protein
VVIVQQEVKLAAEMHMPHWRESSYITVVNPSQLLASLLDPSDVVHTENPMGESMRLGSIREPKL